MKLPVNFEVTAKTEVPSESSGRLLDALTDVIRPFTEARGLRADQIRLQREDVLIEIARKARDRALEENLQISQVPNRVLVPLLEKASLTDQDNNELKETWAKLLLTASTKPISHPNVGLFTNLLSQMAPEHLKLLDSLHFHAGQASLGVAMPASIETTIHNAAQDRKNPIFKSLMRLKNEGGQQEISKALLNWLKAVFQGQDRLILGLAIHFGYNQEDRGFFLQHSDLEEDLEETLLLVEGLKSLGIVKEENSDLMGELTTLQFQAEHYRMSGLTVLSFTSLGADFLWATHPKFPIVSDEVDI